MKAPTVSVDILVIDDGKALLGLFTDEWSYQGKPTWGLPGREIEFGEHFNQAIERNIQEELGCSLQAYEIIAVNANYAFDNHYVGIGATATIEGEPKIMKSEDWQKWEWFDLDNLPENLFKPAENLIKCYLKLNNS